MRGCCIAPIQGWAFPFSILRQGLRFFSHRLSTTSCSLPLCLLCWWIQWEKFLLCSRVSTVKHPYFCRLFFCFESWMVSNDTSQRWDANTTMTPEEIELGRRYFSSLPKALSKYVKRSTRKGLGNADFDNAEAHMGGETDRFWLALNAVILTWSFCQAMLSLYMSIANGVSWEQVIIPLNAVPGLVWSVWWFY